MTGWHIQQWQHLFRHTGCVTCPLHSRYLVCAVCCSGVAALWLCNHRSCNHPAYHHQREFNVSCSLQQAPTCCLRHPYSCITATPLLHGFNLMLRHAVKWYVTYQGGYVQIGMINVDLEDNGPVEGSWADHVAVTLQLIPVGVESP